MDRVDGAILRRTCQAHPSKCLRQSTAIGDIGTLWRTRTADITKGAMRCGFVAGESALIVVFVVEKRPVAQGSGFIADFCLICRTARVFEVQRVGLAWSMFGLRLGAATYTHEHQVCRHCRQALPHDPAWFTQRASAPETVDRLIHITQPAFAARHARRLKIEEQMRDSAASLDPAIRADLLHAPFVLLSAQLDQRFATTQLDWRQLAALVFGLPCAILLLLPIEFLLERVGVPIAQTGPWIALAAFTAYVGLVLWVFRRARRHFFEREILPAFALAVAGLSPSREELTLALVHHRSGPLRHWRRLTPAWLDTIARLPAPARWPAQLQASSADEDARWRRPA
ncbi:hypothetical protein [Xanthomonas arboricola]|nr:hypothetical protein [Xanthomonas arboricola]